MTKGSKGLCATVTPSGIEKAGGMMLERVLECHKKRGCRKIFREGDRIECG